MWALTGVYFGWLRARFFTRRFPAPSPHFRASRPPVRHREDHAHRHRRAAAPSRGRAARERGQELGRGREVDACFLGGCAGAPDSSRGVFPLPLRTSAPAARPCGTVKITRTGTGGRRRPRGGARRGRGRGKELGRGREVDRWLRPTSLPFTHPQRARRATAPSACITIKWRQNGGGCAGRGAARAAATRA